MRTYIYIHTYIHTHVHTYTHIHTYMRGHRGHLEDGGERGGGENHTHTFLPPASLNPLHATS
jgi:hypothetical protein